MKFRFVIFGTVSAISLAVASPVRALTLPIPAGERVTRQTRAVDVQILLYHYVRPLPPDRLGASLSVTPEAFEDQLRYLLLKGYHFITPPDLLEALRGKSQLPDRSILLTFDDGTADVATTVFPILQRYGIPATFFIIAGFISTPGYLTWEQLKIIAQSPLVTLGAHGENHVSLTTLKNPVAFDQLVTSWKVLAAATKRPVTTVAYPNGSFNQSLEALTAKAGYDLGFTTRRGTRAAWSERFRLPRSRAGQSVSALKRVLESSGFSS